MGSNQSMISQKPDKSLPSIYCEYSDKCPSRNRSAICVPCLYKNITGQQRPERKSLYKCNELCSNNPNLQYKEGYPLVNGICKNCVNYKLLCSCTPAKLCGTCREFIRNYVFPPAAADRLSLLKPYESDNNYAKF